MSEIFTWLRARVNQVCPKVLNSTQRNEIRKSCRFPVRISDFYVLWHTRSALESEMCEYMRSSMKTKASAWIIFGYFTTKLERLIDWQRWVANWHKKIGISVYLKTKLIARNFRLVSADIRHFRLDAIATPSTTNSIIINLNIHYDRAISFLSSSSAQWQLTNFRIHRKKEI